MNLPTRSKSIYSHHDVLAGRLKETIYQGVQRIFDLKVRFSMEQQLVSKLLILNPKSILKTKIDDLTANLEEPLSKLKIDSKTEVLEEIPVVRTVLEEFVQV